jgi:DNA invertase Pin-like site-specific DNA recombinase
MIYGYVRVSTDGQSVAAQVAALRKHGAGKVFREPFKLTDHQKREAIKRREQGETLADIGRSYNVSPATIPRLAAHGPEGNGIRHYGTC